MKQISLYKFITIMFCCLSALPAFAQTAHQTHQDLYFSPNGYFHFFGAQAGNALDTVNSGGCYIGTMGSMVTDGQFNYILSNNHVLARTNKGVVGEDIMHVAGCEASPLHIGELAKFVPISFNRLAANYVDAALARISTKVTSDGGIIGQDFNNIFYVDPTSQTAYVGMPVRKSGRTTGLTSGVINAIHVNVSVSYGKIAYFRDQIIITGNGGTSFSAGGDSGSLILMQDTDGNNLFAPVGLLFAGNSTSTIANPIDRVLSELGGNLSFGSSGDAGIDNLGGSDGGGSTPPGKGGKGNSKSALVHPGIANAVAARDKNEEKIMGVSGVHGSGIGLDANGQPTIDIFVQRITSRVRTLIPSEMEGVPVRLIETDEFIAF